MPVALDGIAKAAGADGAVLLRENPGGFFEASESPGMIPVTDYANADRPPDPRPLRVNPRLDEGFRLDHDDFGQQELARNPFYQEFLRPREYFWHACALLLADKAGGGLYLTLKRRWRRGAFGHAEVAPLARLLPSLRRLADAAETLSRAAVLHRHFGKSEGELALFLDRDGHMLDRLPEEPIAGGLLTINRGRLSATLPAASDLVVRLIERAIERRAPAFAHLRADDLAQSWILKIVPVPRSSRLHWQLPLCVALVSNIRRQLEPGPEVAVALSDLFGLSVGEARVAALLSHGWTIESAAASLNLAPGTVRNQLKAVFAKMHISRQADLVLIVSRM